MENKICLHPIACLMALFCLYGCQTADENVVERVVGDVKMVTNDLMTSMPCEMLVYRRYARLA